MITDDIMLPHMYDRYMKSREWISKIPYIQFPTDWEIQIIPPFAGATIRFRVKRGDSEVSVYLDCHDNLGYMGEPYREIYPYEDDTFRCLLEETDKLLEAIEKSLENNSRLLGQRY